MRARQRRGKAQRPEGRSPEGRESYGPAGGATLWTPMAWWTWEAACDDSAARWGSGG